MDYYTYWNITTAASGPLSDEGVIQLAGIVMLAIGLILILFRNRLPMHLRNALPYGVAALGALLMVSYFYIDFAKKKLPELNPRNQVAPQKVIEGKIKNYKEKILNAPRGGTQTVASFEVEDVAFHFSGVNLSKEARFNKTHSKGGILNNGMQTRITYESGQNIILKIELIKE